MEVENTKLRGLLLVHLDVMADERGRFTEAFNAAKAVPQGLPDIKVVQANASLTGHGGLRGIHAEPWEKYINVPWGEVHAVIVDLRPEEPTFGQHVPFHLDHSVSLFVPRGMGNSFQVLSKEAVYTYLVTAHWSADEAPYPAVRYDDPDLGIEWPLPVDESNPASITAKDVANPSLREAYPEPCARWLS